MKKFSFLLLDTDVVIELFQQGVWEHVIHTCDIHVAETIVDEANYYYNDRNERCLIDLKRYGDGRKITVFSVSAGDIRKFKSAFDPIYFEKMDAGETESLAHLMSLPADARLCSADKIVFRVLGNLDRSPQGISLEEVLNSSGLGRNLARQFSKAYREDWTKRGVEERLYGVGKIKS